MAERTRHGELLAPTLMVVALFGAAAALAALDLSHRLPSGGWLQVLLAPDPDRVDQMLVNVTIYSRMAVAMMVGAALGLSGTVLQQVLRNPLAEPATIGVSAGAHIALAVAAAWFPSALAAGRELPALFGALAALATVLGLSWRQGLSPVTVILAGLVVSLYCGAMGAVVALFQHDMLIGLFLWGAGFLDQQGWEVATALALELLVLGAGVALIARPLAVLSVGDEGAKSLGLSLAGARVAALLLAVGLAAAAVVAVGVISFVGLAAPALARLAGARQVGRQLVFAPLVGAGMLWLTDEIVLLLPVTYRGVPTGALTAVVGVPLLLWMLPRLKAMAPPGHAVAVSGPRVDPVKALGVLALLAGAAIVLGLALGADEQGFRLSVGSDFAAFLPWRAPRAAAAFAGGAILGVCGAVLQRMTANPMAAPEVLGVSTGATLGFVALMFVVEYPGRMEQIAAGALGAGAVMALMLALGRRSGYGPERLLLAGVATSALFGVVMAAITASQDPRLGLILSWLSGSTYAVSDVEAAVTAGCAVVAIAAIPFVARWLDVLPLGEVPARALGVSPAFCRAALVALTSLLTAAATVIIGPLSFCGLIAPHIARLIGLRRAAGHLLGAALVGGTAMVAADALGRTILFPFQIPAGLLAAIIGGPYLLWLLRSQRAA